MNLMEHDIRRRPPSRVLEFGSGLSTACLARYMAENGPAAPLPAIVSVEEDSAFCKTSRPLDAALEEGRRWSELPRVDILGVALVGHGVLVGEARSAGAGD